MMSSLKKITENILFIIPAKGNSTRIKNKNILKVNGRRLIEYTFNFLKKINIKHNVYVSSESIEIKKITIKHGLKFIKRPKNLCKKSSSTESAIIHSINYLKKRKKTFKWVVTLPPTSPLRSVETFLKVLKLIKLNNFDSVITICKNKGYFWVKNRSSKFKKLFPKASRRQQNRNSLFEETSSIYANKIKTLVKTNSMINGKIGYVETSKDESIDINDSTDLVYLSSLIKKNN